MTERPEVEKRRRFRPADIQARYLEQGGCCALCPLEIGERFIADHRVPRALGGKTNKANLDLICVACDLEKTFGKGGDISRIAKTNRLIRKSDPATRRQSKRPLRSRGFDKRMHHHMDGTRSER